MGTITTEEFLGLETVSDDTQKLTMKNHLLGGGSGSLFGGVGVAGGLLGLERITGQAPVYMTCQFAATVVPPAELVFTTEILAKGRTVSQARITAFSEGKTILALLGATGDRTEQHRGMFRTMPDAPPPEELESLDRTSEIESLHHHVDVRMARGAFGFAPAETGGQLPATADGSALFWARMPNVHHDAAALSMIADYLPTNIGNSLGTQVFCSSLDNTVRFPGPIDVDTSSEWVLCESHADVIGAGFASNTGFLWSRDGRLLAVANQSVTVATPRPQ